jgi:hypothetical protein
MAAAFAGFTMLYTLFSKFMPIVALTDVHEGEIIKSQTNFGRTKVENIIEGD